MNESTVDRLRRERPRDRFVRASVVALLALIVAAWVFGDFDWRATFAESRAENLARFIEDATPAPARAGGDGTSWWAWGWRLMREVGFEATINTLAIAVAAVVLAGVAATPFSLLAARNVATAEPFLPSGARPSRLRRQAWRVVVFATRAVLIFLRAIPEYVWAFVFLAMLGPSAWPAVIALALHNHGILGKLGAEAVENVDPRVPAALRGLGAGRMQVAVIGIFPTCLPRFLLYFFYRWETCVREATILGLLGFSSLGLWILEARARNNYDEMLFFVLVGSAIVLAGDVLSAIVRALVRRAV